MKKWTRLIWSMLALVAVYAFVNYSILPGTADKKLRDTLSLAGFDTALLPAPRTTINGLTYENISLDNDGVSTIQKIEVTYDPFSLIVMRKLGYLKISGADLTGEWNGGPSMPAFAGWTPAIAAGFKPDLYFRSIKIEKGSLSVLTPMAGALTFEIDMDIAKSGRQSVFSADISTEQKFLSLAATITGKIGSNAGDVDITIHEGRIEDPAARILASRMSGQTSVSWDEKDGMNIGGEIRAGRAVLFGMPWNDVNMNVVDDGPASIFNIRGHSPGDASVLLDLAVSVAPGQPIAAQGSITAAKAYALLDYLKAIKGYNDIKQSVESAKAVTDLVVLFRMMPEMKTPVMAYELKKQTTALDIAGQQALPEAKTNP